MIKQWLVPLFVAMLATAAGPATRPVALPPSGDDGAAAKVLAASPRHGEWVDVPLAGSTVKLHAWVVYPERPDPAPVVIVVHEIFGMTDWVRGVTDQLAAEGFIAVAPDLLSGFGPDGGGTDSLGPNVGPTIRKLTPADQAARLDAVRDYALALPSATKKYATIGFCWGGGTSFAYAAHDPRLSAAVVCYGTPPQPDTLSHITCPVLGLYGGDDARVTTTVGPTAKLMADLHKAYAPHVYPGAGHGFMRQQSGRNGANQAAAQQGWAEATRFLRTHLADQPDGGGR